MRVAVDDFIGLRVVQPKQAHDRVCVGKAHPLVFLRLAEGAQAARKFFAFGQGFGQKRALPFGVARLQAKCLIRFVVQAKRIAMGQQQALGASLQPGRVGQWLNAQRA